MIDPELGKHLRRIEGELSQMHEKTVSMRHSFGRGVVYGAGYVIGTVLIIIAAGWLLNLIGIMPGFGEKASEFRTTLENVGRTIK